MRIFELAEQAREQGRGAALCIIVRTVGSTPRGTGAKMLVYADGCIAGTIGGGHLEKDVIADALKAIASGLPETHRHDLLHRHGMCCGGAIEIYIEPIRSMQRLYIFGAGHTGRALAALAVPLGFDTYVIDSRQELLGTITTEGVQRIGLPPAEVLPSLPFDMYTYVTIMTHDHATDREILAHCIKRPTAYVGMIGSKRKVEVTRKMFEAGGVAERGEIDRVDMPMGMAIGADGPGEIAISIMAKLIQIRNTRQ